MHEAGHGLYGLADEYGGGSHWQAMNCQQLVSLAVPKATPRLWNCKESSDVGANGQQWLVPLCVSNCQMVTTGLTHNEYDVPAKQNNYVVFETLQIKKS